MKLSYEWLSEFVDLTGLSPDKVAELLTMGAFEVEEVKRVGADIEGPLVIGKILEISKHPNADKIRVTQVKVDETSAPLQIVCGADNIEVGQIIPVALPGSRVLNRKDGSALHINASEKRGVMSNGMLCSPSELGYSGLDVDGILILSDHPEIIDPDQLKLGRDAKEALGLTSDFVLHVAPRSNRGDALSVVGLAREVAALTGRPLKIESLPLAQSGAKKLQTAPFKTHIADLEDCPIFTIREIANLKVAPSPRYIVRRLEAIGVRPVNNIVDITNYVMHELGQPLHAYDTHRIKGRMIEVRRAKDDESLETIDGKSRPLTHEMLVIADQSGPIGVAGVMGGKDSEIGEDTSAIALEAAAFQPARVRRGSRLLGLSSESSLRFERGVDVKGVTVASDRASNLIAKCCGAGGNDTAYGELSTAGSDSVPATRISLRTQQIKRLLDIEIPADEIERLLDPLGFSCENVAGDSSIISVNVPSFRLSDVTREIDVIEEVARLYGYDRLPSQMPKSTNAPEAHDDILSMVRHALSAAGLSEAWTSSLVRSETVAGRATNREAESEVNGEGDTFGLSQLENESRLVEVLNPLSDEHQVLRQSLVPGLVRAAQYNQDRGRKDIHLFETGRTYLRTLTLASMEHGETGVEETLKAAGLLMGSRRRSAWQAEEQESEDFFRAKGVVENLLASLNVDLGRIRFFPTQTIGCLHPYRSAHIVHTQNPFEKSADSHSTKKLGFIGQLHPGLTDKLGLTTTVHVFELNLDEIRPLRHPSIFAAVPATPCVVRDLTVDIAHQVDHASVQSTIRASAGKLLTGSELVSVFKLNDDLRSLSYRLTFQDPECTLTNEQVEERLSKVRESLKSRIGASFRS